MSTADPAFPYAFTIFTPTYNRAHSLHRVWDSLRDQSFRDFEWLIVDNASTDGTEALVAESIEDGGLAIRYLRNEENIGRQGSWQRAIEEARGELFVEMRSADGCTPDALAVLHAQWMSIPDEERHRFSAVSGLAVDERGRLIGTPFPFDVTDSDSLEIRYRYRVKGDKSGIQRSPFSGSSRSQASGATSARYRSAWCGAPSRGAIGRGTSTSASESSGRTRRTGCRGRLDRG